MVSNIDAFIRETNAEIEKLQAKQVSEAKKIILGAFSEIVSTSPADTGLFRNNNFITVNAPSSATVDAPNKNTQSVIASALPVVGSLKFSHKDTIYIQNNLQYADALEAGHSQQAPAGVYGVTERKIEKILARTTEI